MWWAGNHEAANTGGVSETRYPQLVVDSEGDEVIRTGAGGCLTTRFLRVKMSLYSCGQSYPQADPVIHRKQAVIHRRSAMREASGAWRSPDVGEVGA